MNDHIPVPPEGSARQPDHLMIEVTWRAVSRAVSSRIGLPKALVAITPAVEVGPWDAQHVQRALRWQMPHSAGRQP